MFRSCLWSTLGIVCALSSAQELPFDTLAPRHPLRAGLPPSLQDIEARLDANHDLRVEDEITWAHEGTHYIDSRLSREPVRAFYCLEGRVYRLRHPKISIAQIAAALPPALRTTSRYRNYLVASQPHWNAQPLYVLEEWLAYVNGSQVRKELGWTKRGETEQHMAELGVFVSALVDLTKKNDPEYDLQPLVSFVRWNAARGQEIAGTRWNELPAFVAAKELKYAPAIDLMDLSERE